VIVVACNTVHVFFDEMQQSVSVPMLSIVDETVRTVAIENVKRVLVLGTPFTLQNKLYQNKLQKAGVKVEVPNIRDQKRLFEVIISVLNNGPTRKSQDELLSIINAYKRGVDGVVLGCTELPLVLRNVRMEIRTFDTLQILADAVYNYSIS
jgi:aspartate racemase